MRAYRALARLITDLWSGVRALKRSPGFVLASVLTLALGIGASTALFGVVHGVLFKPLPYPNADRLLVVLAEQDFEGTHRPVRVRFPAQAVAAWPAQGRTFESVGFYAEEGATLARARGSERMNVAVVSGSFFETVRGEIVSGRPLTRADARRPVAVVSERLLHRLDAGAPIPVGGPIVLNGQVFTIVGVVGRAFQIPAAQTDLWIPAGAGGTDSPGCCAFTPVVRLQAEVSKAAAGDEIAAIARTLAAQMPRALGGVRVQVAGLRDLAVGDARPALRALTAAVALLLVLACANVIGLLLTRNTARAHQTAIRRALGASRGRLMADSLAESGLLAAAGGLVGLGVAAIVVRALKAWPPTGMPGLDSVQIDGSVVLFAWLVAATAALIVGILPSLHAGDVGLALKPGQRGTLGSRRTRAALRAVTVAQLAISMVLLVGTFLLGRSLAALMRTDLGVLPDHVATASLELGTDHVRTDQQQRELVTRIVERVASLPHVTAAGVGAARPPDTSRARLTLKMSDDPNERASYQAVAVPATPGYFRALGIRLERGRLFTDADAAQAPPVVIISADTARQLFTGRDPLGQTINLPVLRDGVAGRETMTVVGITANVKYGGLDQAPDALVYRPVAQQPWRSLFLVARTSGDPQALAAQFQRETAAVDRTVIVSNVTTLDAVLSDAVAQPKFRAFVLAAFASIAVVIAGVGLYGVIAYSVSLRKAEIGLRMALGADRRRIRIMVLREGLVLAVLGGALGSAGAYGSTRLPASLLFGIAPTDATSFATAAAAIIAAGVLATCLPATRAARVSPLTALQSE